MDNLSGRVAKTVAVTLAVFLIAAGTLAQDNRPARVVLWAGLTAAAGYIKGKFEEKP